MNDEFSGPDLSKLHKLCIWFNPVTGVPLPESGIYRQDEPTPAKPEAPVFIVPYGEDGRPEQADIYFHNGATVVAFGHGPSGACFGTDYIRDFDLKNPGRG